jgi:hypothetical protein
MSGDFEWERMVISDRAAFTEGFVKRCMELGADPVACSDTLLAFEKQAATPAELSDWAREEEQSQVENAKPKAFEGGRRVREMVSAMRALRAEIGK